MSIENRDLPAGTKLVAKYKGQGHIVEVVATEAGIRYRLADGRAFQAPLLDGLVIDGTAAAQYRCGRPL